jgi:hypothetical protein
VYKLVKLFTFYGDPCHNGTKTEKQVTVLLACNDKQPPLVRSKHRNNVALKKKKPCYHRIQMPLQIISRISEDNLAQLEENAH